MKRSLLAAAAALACCASSLGSAAAATAARPIGVGSVDTVQFKVHFPLRNVEELDGLIASQTTKGSPFYHRWLTPAQFRARYGPDPAALHAAVASLRASGLDAAVTSTQFITARGRTAAVEQLFSTRLTRGLDRLGRVQLRTNGPIRIPAAIGLGGGTVFDLGARLPLKPAGRIVARAVPNNRYGPFGPYFADDLKQAYAFPSYETVNGKGVNVAIVGTSDFSDRDLALYLGHEKIGDARGDLAPFPTVKHAAAPGSLPFDPNDGNSVEANLDVQQVAMTAPGATITVFATPNLTDGGFADIYTQIDESNQYDIVSTSFGGCELVYTAAYNYGQDYTGILRSENELFKQGNSQGITFVFSSGDNAGLSCPEPGYFLNPPTKPPTAYKYVKGVQSFASEPNALAVGGGELRTSASPGASPEKPGPRVSTYVAEDGYAYPLGVPEDPYGTGNILTNALIGAGGGASAVFRKPAYQRGIRTGTHMRAVPDVGGHFGSYSLGGSYDITYVGGQPIGLIGTSASAPDFAGLLALKAQGQQARLGLEQTDIYELAKNNNAFPYHFFHQGIPGYNGVVNYPAGRPGYNFIYGVGSAYGANFAFLPFTTLAGDPQTPTNP